jgi:hypothetical protein
VNIADKLAKRRRREEPVDLCLDPNLARDYAAAEAELEAINAEAATRRKQAHSLDGGDLSDLDERRAHVEARLERLAAEVAEMTVTLTAKALGSKRWDELLISHPQRRDESGSVVVADKYVGINVSTFFREAIPESITELTREQWAELLDGADPLGDADYNALANAVWTANTQPVNASPLARARKRAASKQSPTSVDATKPPNV